MATGGSRRPRSRLMAILATGLTTLSAGLAQSPRVMLVADEFWNRRGERQARVSNGRAPISGFLQLPFREGEDRAFA